MPPSAMHGLAAVERTYDLTLHSKYSECVTILQHQPGNLIHPVFACQLSKGTGQAVSGHPYI